MDLPWMDVFRAQPPDLTPIAAMRTAVRSAFASLGATELGQLREAMAVPAVRARMLEEFARTAQIIAGAVAAWFDQPGDLEGFGDRFEHGLALLESGLPV